MPSPNLYFSAQLLEEKLKNIQIECDMNKKDTSNKPSFPSHHAEFYMLQQSLP